MTRTRLDLESTRRTSATMIPASDEITRPSRARTPRWVRFAKALRTSQPFNLAATSGVKAALRILGRESEAAIRRLHRVGTVRSRLPNGRTLRLWTRADDFIANQVYWRGWDGHEPETTPVFWHLASSARATLDIGAHVGLLALIAAHANPSGRVFAFEPFRPVFERLRLNAARNRLSNLECLNAAVGDSAGTLDFYHIEDDGRSLPTSSSLSREFMVRSLAELGLPEARLRHSPVPVLTVDDFVRSRAIEAVDLVKIDTESTEPAVLRGMAETLRRDRPSLIVEILPGASTLPEIEAMLVPLGYRHARLLPRGARALRIHEATARVTGRPDGFDNYLFTTGDPERVLDEAHAISPTA